MIYRVILTRNGEYKCTLYRCKTRATAFVKHNLLIEQNKNIFFPKKYVNSNKITPVKYEICITKPTESTDEFRIIKDEFGRNYTEQPIGDWTILAKHPYNIEEKFWLYGNDARANRVGVDEIIKRLVKGAYKKKMVKQVIVVYNKLLIYNEDQFDMIICKCKADAQRLHHSLSKVATKQKIKSLLFMGTATQATASKLYEVIKEHTGWPYHKIWKTHTSS